MKIFMHLLAIVCVSNATFLNFFGNKGGGSSGGSHVTYSIADPHSHDHGHGHDHGHQISHASSYSHDHGHDYSNGYGGSAQVIKVIFEAGHGGSYGDSGSQSYGNGHGYGLSGGNAEIFSIITQNSGDPVADASYGHSSGPSYGSNYRNGGSLNYNSQLHAILPHILQLILQNDFNNGSGGGNTANSDAVNSQLLAHFGEMGTAVVKRIQGRPKSYYSEGHVVQQGVLEIKRIQSAPAQGPPDHFYSSHGPPVHGW